MQDWSLIWGGQRERERTRADPLLGTEPKVWLDLTTLTPGPELKSEAEAWPTGPPGVPASVFG